MKRRRTINSPINSPFGCQLWVEPDDSPERLRKLMNSARESGLSRLRIFLLWTRIEHRPGHFDFAAYDNVFDTAATVGLGIKATLTANSGPWHVGTPAALHSHTGFLCDSQRKPMESYIRECVQRYAGHPALVQWLLWNEPHGGFKDHVESNLPGWRSWLKEKYRGQIERLNLRWLTGFSGFGEVGWPEDIPHPAHAGGSWTPYAPSLDEMEWRAARLVSQVRWVAAEVRKHDRQTELCINPIFTIENKAGGATDMAELAASVDRIGSSYHPVFWHELTGREDYPAMIGAGVSALVSMGGGRPVELTEVISGNSFQTGSRSCAVGDGEIARFYLAALACGAETVTGWCLNARPRDGEAGEFALLDDNEEVSGRGRMLSRLAAAIRECRKLSGEWFPPAAEVTVAVDRRSQAVDLLDSESSSESPRRCGRGPQDAGRSAWLMAARAMQSGYGTAIVEPRMGEGFPPEAGRTLIVSHLRCWEKQQASSLLAFARSGGTLVVDALSGRKDYDSAVYRPWPGHLAQATGLTVRELETGSPDFGLSIDGRPAAVAVTFRTHVLADRRWQAWDWCRFSDDLSPAILVRSYGRGRIIYARFALGPSLLADRENDSWFRRLLIAVAGSPSAKLLPAPGVAGTFSVPVRCKNGTTHIVIAPDLTSRGGAPLRLVTRPGTEWMDFWTGGSTRADDQGEFTLPMEEGIAILMEKRK